MAKILVAFYSRTGTVESLAKAVADGASQAGAEVRLRRAREFVSPEVMAKAPGWTESAERMNAAYEAPTEADADWADAIVFGTPTRFGAVCAELKAYIDSLGGLWAQGKLAGKVGSAFSASSALHGGNETTITCLFPPMAHFGMIIVPPGYTDPAMFAAGTPYGATAATGRDRRPITEPERQAAIVQGRRVAQIAAQLRPAAGAS
jgi:NAD(P)H dehydrogenase (quinone)